MEIGPTSRVDMGAPVASFSASQDWQMNDRQVVAAIQWLKQTDWLADDRELMYKRDPKTGRLVIQILDRQSRDVIDQIPPESILRLVTELQAELKSKDENA